ncbi:MAG: hypothetical protein ABSB15_27375 [Bryobacteraceae bacterium]|jgi:hypothetical protein
MLRVFLALAAAACAFANPEYSRRTGKECNYCHPANNFHLNEAGKYYKDHGKSLKGYVPSAPRKDTPPAAAQQKAPPAQK